MGSGLDKLIAEEGDTHSWEHASLACRMVRHDSLKHWCGYVGLPKAHPSHGKGYDDVEASVHGGLTYAADHAPNEPSDGLWWVGFDCAHSGDLVPGMGRLGGIDRLTLDLGNLVGPITSDRGDTYRDAEFVQAETNRLADQLGASK